MRNLASSVNGRAGRARRLLDLFLCCICFLISCARSNFNNSSTGFKESGCLFSNCLAGSFRSSRFSF